ncbi:MAG TPA: hypothetical protein VGF86_05730 [Candidatus Tumulicola sp.]|jgi:hypothetical protein
MRALRCFGLVAACAAGGLAGCVAGGGAPSVEPPAGVPNVATRVAAGLRRPHYMPTFGSARPFVRPDNFLTYGGGPVLVKPKMYLTLWGYEAAGDPERVAKLLQRYGAHVGASAYDNIYTQYYEVSGGKTIHIANPSNQFGGVWNDDSTIPKAPTDEQVAAEALRAVKHFGYDPNGSYVVATAHNHSTSGFGTSFCGYHSSTQYKKRNVSYTNLPYVPDAGAACGANAIGPAPGQSGKTEGVTIVEGHEYAETVTDPMPFSGWNSVQGEIADMCGVLDIENDPFGTKHYASQAEFSDATQSCVHHYP